MDSDAKWEFENNQIETMFPNINFTIAISLDDFDEVLTDKKTIVVKNSYNGYCYDKSPRKTDWFTIHSPCMTNRSVLTELVKQNLCLDCNHRFVEGFHFISDCQFDIVTGS